MSNTRVLVFPIDIASSEAFIDAVTSIGATVYAASSELTEYDSGKVAGFYSLPYLTNEDFHQHFSELINAREITHVYTAHIGIWLYLKQMLDQKTNPFNFELCEPSPFDHDWLSFENSYRWAIEENKNEASNKFDENSVKKGAEDLSIPISEKCLSTAQLAGLHRQFHLIPGQCNESKLSALNVLFKFMPRGDLIEIGSFYGRSAFAIGYLARLFQIGNLICVDPWQSERTEKQESQLLDHRQKLDQMFEQNHQALIAENISNLNPKSFDECAFYGFAASCGLMDNVNYIRERSVDAINEYRKASVKGYIESKLHGKTKVEGQVSFLHIDGNHAYDHVKQDVECWTKYLMPGGWLALDDYEWAFGDGPRRVGDELIQSSDYETSFVLADTLFLQKSATV